MRTFEFSSTNKRYHTFDYYVKKTFGEKVVKVGLDGGFTCPNRDGTKGFGGCAFCAGRGRGKHALRQKRGRHRKCSCHRLPFPLHFQESTPFKAPI